MTLDPQFIAAFLMGVAIFVKQIIDGANTKNARKHADERADEIKKAINAAMDDLKDWCGKNFMKIQPGE